jgi:hypothetical protein
MNDFPWKFCNGKRRHEINPRLPAGTGPEISITKKKRNWHIVGTKRRRSRFAHSLILRYIFFEADILKNRYYVFDGTNFKKTFFSNAFRTQKPPKLSELKNLTEGDNTYKGNALVSRTFA